MRRKILSILSVAILVASFIPVSNAFAADGPQISFEEPDEDVTVTVNDPVHVKVDVVLGSSSEYTLTWHCDNVLSYGYSCPDANSSDGNIAYLRTGDYHISATARDNNGLSDTAELVVHVVSDPPTVNATSDRTRYQVGESGVIRVEAMDEYGTVNSFAWGCGRESDFEDEFVLSRPSKEASHNITVAFPDTPTDDFECRVMAMDDDGETNITTINFAVFVPDEENDTPAPDVTEPEEDPKPSADTKKKEVSAPDTGVVVKGGRSAEAEIVVTMVSAFVLVAAIRYKRLNKNA